jgi:hypothetical protein
MTELSTTSAGIEYRDNCRTHRWDCTAPRVLFRRIVNRANTRLLGPQGRTVLPSIL